MTTTGPRRPISDTPKPPRRSTGLPKVDITWRPSLPSLPKLPHLPKLSGIFRADREASRPDPISAGPVDPAPGVHPKIASRRDEVAEQTRTTNRRARFRWISVGVAATLTAVVALLFSPLFDLDHLDVSGIEGDPAAEVRDVAGLDEHTAMFSVRPSAVRGAVQGLPWVAHAAVTVHWPDRVDITVTPHRPVAVLAAGARDAAADSMLTASGRVLSYEDAGPLLGFAASLPTVRLGTPLDDEATSAETLAVVSLLDSLGPVTSSLVGELLVDDAGRASIVAGPGPIEGAEMVLGPIDRLPEKAQALEASVAGAIDLCGIRRVDVSVPSRVTILRDGGCDAQQ